MGQKLAPANYLHAPHITYNDDNRGRLLENYGVQTMIQPTAKRRKLLETDVDHDSSSSDLDNAEVVNGKADEAPSMAPKEASSTISVAGQRKVSNPKTSRIHQRLELGTGAVLSKTQHKSNLFKMQMDELLHEVRLRDKSQLGEIDKFLRTIKNAIEAISDQPEKSVGFLPTIKPASSTAK